MQRAIILKELIEKTGLSLKAFSARAGIPYTTLRSILERGIGHASVDNVLKICKSLNITVDELNTLAYGDENPKPKANTIAAHLDGVELTEEETAELNNYIDFILSRRGK